MISWNYDSERAAEDAALFLDFAANGSWSFMRMRGDFMRVEHKICV